MSVTWEPNRYLAHADERGRPFVELLARVPGQPRTVVDLGCGAGNLASVVRGRWPDVDLLGVDSAEMIEHARSVDPPDATRWPTSRPGRRRRRSTPSSPTRCSSGCPTSST